MRKLCALALIALVAISVAPQTAAAARTARILVHFDRQTGAARQEALIARVGGLRLATLHRLGTTIVRVPAADRTQALTLLRHQPGVAYAERDGLVRAAAISVNDPLLNSSSWPLANPFFPDAWSLSTGDPGVVVAVVDSGVQAGHPDLAPLLSGYDFVHNDADPTDDNGHGTAVAGIIAAQGNNGIGIAGVCWACEIMPVKVLDSSGSGTDSWVSSGIVWAADHGADVINLSLGGTSSSQTLADAVSYAQQHDVVVVAAAGNSGVSTLDYPAAYSGVLSVGAVDQSSNRFPWSNYGGWVMVDAPGCTTSTGLGGTYVGFCGTSAAAPFVTGLAGLARSQNQLASAPSIVGVIEQSAHLLPSGNSAHGLIDAACTLQAVASVSNCLVASFNASALSGPAPLTVSFGNTSTNATSYTWAFGDGAGSTDVSPSHTFTVPGSYNVTLIASDGASRRLASATITVTAPLPVANFSASTSSGRAPLSVSFSNGSINATSYLWSFGDGSAGSSEVSPRHAFEKAGTYTVTLTATGPGGAATASTTITISKPQPDLALSLVRKATRTTHGRRSSSFAVRLTNGGGAADQGVKVTITVPAGSKITRASTGGRRCSLTKRRLVCSFGTLAAGATGKLSFVATVTTRAKVKASVSGNTTEISRANNAVSAKTR